MSDTGLSLPWAILGGLAVGLCLLASLWWACRSDERGPEGYE